jgi:hypothetical protein
MQAKQCAGAQFHQFQLIGRWHEPPQLVLQKNDMILNKFDIYEEMQKRQFNIAVNGALKAGIT